MAFFPTPILVATDGAPPSRHALLAAVELARATGSPLHLLHVSLTTGTLRGRPMTPAQRDRADAESHALLAREREAAAAHGLEVADVHLRYAERVDVAVVQVQEELGAGLTVIGEARTGSLAQALLGSGGTRSTATVRRSRASVWVVRPPVDGG